MDQKSIKNKNNYYFFITKTLHFLVPISLFSFFLFLHNLHSSNLIFTLLDRKYMFLICNGILAVLAKNLKLSSSNLNYVEIAEDGVQQITELPLVSEEDAVQENAASVDYIESVAVLEGKQDHVDSSVPEEKQIELQREIKGGGFLLESDQDDEDEDDDEIEESGGSEGILLNDARVSTEEWNQKFEEFIRKMKEEIRIEARQHLIAV